MPILDLRGEEPARFGSRVLDIALPGKSAAPPGQPRNNALGIAKVPPIKSAREPWLDDRAATTDLPRVGTVLQPTGSYSPLDEPRAWPP
jgi:hypothetical protein